MKNISIEEVINAQNQPFKCAVFSGGGAKGAIYSGAHEALSKAGILHGLDAVAGSSAGSITAAMVATGINSEKFKRITQETNLKGLLGEGFIVNKDGKPLLDLLKNTIRSNISEYLENVDVVSACRLRLENIAIQKSSLENLSPAEQQESLEEFTRQETMLNNIINSNGKEIEDIRQKSLDPEGKILFKDLALLRILDPQQFKDLVVTATRKDTGDLNIFDARNTPDVEIALACRASSSIPVVFAPVKINGIEYVDGGYRDNVPLTYFDKGKTTSTKDISDAPEQIQTAKKTGRTLALAFGTGMDDSANVAIYSAQEKIVNPNRLVKFMMDVVFKTIARVGGMFKYSEEENKTFERVRENALNTVVLDTGDVSTLSFDAAQEKAAYLHIKGSIQTARYLDNHDIAPIKDPNLELKEFMLKIYEDSQAKGTVQSWKDKIVGGKTEKLTELLQFAADGSWQNKSVGEVITDLIIVASTARSSGQHTTNTNTMKTVINALNDAYTPPFVRLEFIQALAIDIEKDKRFDQTKDFGQNLAKFKFTETDLKDKVKDIQSNKLKEQQKNKSTTSMAEKITTEKQNLAETKPSR